MIIHRQDADGFTRLRNLLTEIVILIQKKTGKISSRENPPKSIETLPSKDRLGGAQKRKPTKSVIQQMLRRQPARRDIVGDDPRHRTPLQSIGNVHDRTTMPSRGNPFIRRQKADHAIDRRARIDRCLRGIGSVDEPPGTVVGKAFDTAEDSAAQPERKREEHANAEGSSHGWSHP